MSPNQHDSRAQRRWGDAPHDPVWWLKWAAGIAGSLLVLGTFWNAVSSRAASSVSAPILAKLDALAVRDSVRLEIEKMERIHGDASVKDQLDTIIQLLKKRQR